MIKEQCKYCGAIKEIGDDPVCEHTNGCYIRKEYKQPKRGRKG